MIQTSRPVNVTDTSIRSWVRQADLDTGSRTDGLTTDEKQELTRLRKEVARLREELVRIKEIHAMSDGTYGHPGSAPSWPTSMGCA